MAACPPFHTSESESPNVYHDDDECYEGRKILPENRVEGDGGRPRCEICDDLAR